MRYRIVYQDYFKLIKAGIVIDKFKDWLEDFTYKLRLEGRAL